MGGYIEIQRLLREEKDYHCNCHCDVMIEGPNVEVFDFGVMEVPHHLRRDP